MFRRRWPWRGRAGLSAGWAELRPILASRDGVAELGTQRPEVGGALFPE